MKKKIIIFLVLLLPVLFNYHCKSSSFSFDVNGSWEITITYSCGAEYIVNVSFTGSQTSGDVYVGGVKLGTYSVTDKSISFSYQTLEGAVTYYYEYTGDAKSSDEMEGDISQFYDQIMSNSANLSKPEIKVMVSSGKWKGKRR